MTSSSSGITAADIRAIRLTLTNINTNLRRIADALAPEDKDDNKKALSFADQHQLAKAFIAQGSDKDAVWDADQTVDVNR